MTLSSNEVRHLAISLLTAPTARDRQVRIGASNLSNGCDYCLASNMVGDMRDTPITSRVWGGRVLGTAIHSILEERMQWALKGDEDEGAERYTDLVTSTLADIGRRFPDAIPEYRFAIGELGSYGEVRSTSDLVIPSERHAFDYKGTENRKAAFILDAWATLRGEEPPFGRKHQVHKAKSVSEAQYAKEIRKAEYKIAGYFNQLLLYGLGLWRNGIEIDALSIVFINRDNTMWFDNPTEDGYDDPTKMHGVWTLDIAYNEAAALTVWQRGIDIWNALEQGATPNDFHRHELCFPCGMDLEQEERMNITVIIPEQKEERAA